MYFGNGGSAWGEAVSDTLTGTRNGLSEEKRACRLCLTDWRQKYEAHRMCAGKGL